MSVRIAVVELPTLFVADMDWAWLDNDKVMLTFRCQHENVQNNEDGIFCPDCRNEHLTPAQIEELTDSFVEGRLEYGQVH